MDAQKAQLPKMDDRPTRWSLIFGITLWFLDLNIVYALPSLTCQWGWFPFTIFGVPGLLIIMGAISLISLILMGIMIYLPWRNWRMFQIGKPNGNPQLLKDTEKDRRPLIAFVAMLMNSFFFLFILASFVPMLTLNICVRG